jgi:magnesium transporter
MQHRQNLVELHRRLRALHPADVAHILESLPIDDRLVVWRELLPNHAGQALVEVSRGVRESLLENTGRSEIVGMLKELDADDLRLSLGVAPDDLVDEVLGPLDVRDRSWMEESRACPESSRRG